MKNKNKNKNTVNEPAPSDAFFPGLEADQLKDKIQAGKKSKNDTATDLITKELDDFITRNKEYVIEPGKYKVNIYFIPRIKIGVTFDVNTRGSHTISLPLDKTIKGVIRMNLYRYNGSWEDTGYFVAIPMYVNSFWRERYDVKLMSIFNNMDKYFVISKMEAVKIETMIGVEFNRMRFGELKSRLFFLMFSTNRTDIGNCKKINKDFGVGMRAICVDINKNMVKITESISQNLLVRYKKESGIV